MRHVGPADELHFIELRPWGFYLKTVKGVVYPKYIPNRPLGYIWDSTGRLDSDLILVDNWGRLRLKSSGVIVPAAVRQNGRQWI